MDVACSTHKSDEKCHRILFGKPDGKRPLRTPRCRLEDNIKMHLRDK
jgi:hypothetical protein